MTTTTVPMMDTYPLAIDLDRAILAGTIDALIACSEACTACADSSLSDRLVAGLTKCIRVNMDCADVCDTAGRVLSRHTGYDANLSRALLEACIVACAACGDECASHAADHQHCRVCAEACRAAEYACRNLLATMP